ncbi:hypothetical protein ACFL1H_06050 [Nanoarchaeota archaeon]
MGFFDSLFEESEDELKQEIKEANETIAKAKKKLELIKKNKKKKVPIKKEKKVAPVKKDIFKEEKPKSNYAGVLILIIVLLIAAGGYYYLSFSKPTSFYECFEQPDMGDNAELLCYGTDKVEDTQYILFEIKNTLNQTADCNLDVKIINDGVIKEENNFPIGEVAALSNYKGRFPLDVKEASLSIIPSCN